MKVTAIFFVFALFFVIGCTASKSFMFFDNRNKTEYKVNTVKYKDAIVVNINDIKTVVARFSRGQKDVRASGKYLGHIVELSASYNDYDDCWDAYIYIDGEFAGDVKLTFIE